MMATTTARRENPPTTNIRRTKRLSRVRSTPQKLIYQVFLPLCPCRVWHEPPRPIVSKTVFLSTLLFAAVKFALLDFSCQVLYNAYITFWDYETGRFTPSNGLSSLKNGSFK